MAKTINEHFGSLKHNCGLCNNLMALSLFDPAAHSEPQSRLGARCVQQLQVFHNFTSWGP